MLKALERPRKNRSEIRLEIRLKEYYYRIYKEFRKGLYKTVQ